MELAIVLISAILASLGAWHILGWPWWIVPAIFLGCYVLGFTGVGRAILRFTGAVDGRE